MFCEKKNMKKYIIKPIMDRFVHNGDIVYAKNGQYKVIAAYGEDGNPGCLLRDSVHVFIPNVVITDQEATIIMKKPLLQRSDLDLKQWLQWRFKNFRWDTPEQYDTARYKNEYCYNHDVDGFTEDKYLYEPSITKKRFKKSPKNWYVESHR